MHQRVHGPRHVAVVDEAVLFDVELRVALLDLPRAVIVDAMPQRQILRARRRTNRIRLHETQPLDGVAQRRRRKQAARDRKAPQIGKRWRTIHGRSSVISIIVGRKPARWKRRCAWTFCGAVHNMIRATPRASNHSMALATSAAPIPLRRLASSTT